MLGTTFIPIVLSLRILTDCNFGCYSPLLRPYAVQIVQLQGLLQI